MKTAALPWYNKLLKLFGNGACKLLKQWILKTERGTEGAAGTVLSARSAAVADAPFSDPSRYPGVEQAARLIHGAVERNEKICIFGDYDADGVCACAIMARYLDGLGADIMCLVPTRENGYGLNEDAVKQIHSAGARLLITVDNGIAAVEEVGLAKQLGLTVVVTDHHLPGPELPPADAVFNPHLTPDTPEYDGLFRPLCGAGVALYLCSVLEGAPVEELCEYFGDLAAVATVADLMPLTGDNRALVRLGLEKLAAGDNPGLHQLLLASGVKEGPLTSETVAYQLAPRLNAAGRILSPEPALRLLLTEDEEEAAALAQQLDEANTRRKQLEQQGMADVARLLRECPERLAEPVLVLCGAGWHEGVLGILAARVGRQYGKPVVLLHTENGMCTGSARSVGSFNMYEALSVCADLLERFGGHGGAAGLTVREEQVPALRERLCAYALKNEGQLVPPLFIDTELRAEELTLETVRRLEALAPFGRGNERPVFFIRDVRVCAVLPLSGGKYTKFTFQKDRATFTAVCFSVSQAGCPFAAGDLVHIALCLEENEYGGHTSLSIRLEDIRRSSFRYERYLEQRGQYACALTLAPGNYPQLTRDDVLTLYRHIRTTGGCAEDADALAVRFPSLGFFKTYAALHVLLELNLVHYEQYRDQLLLCVSDAQGKTDLASSPLYALLEGVKG